MNLHEPARNCGESEDEPVFLLTDRRKAFSALTGEWFHTGSGMLVDMPPTPAPVSDRVPFPVPSRWRRNLARVAGLLAIAASVWLLFHVTRSSSARRQIMTWGTMHGDSAPIAPSAPVPVR
jgi:hypothetical protein